MARGAREPEMPQPLDSPEIEPHELFLPETEDEAIIGPPVLAFVSITRLQPYFENGGRCFPYSELPNIEAIGQRFGKGKYRVQARNARKQVIAWREFTIARGAAPLPMDGNGEQEEPKASPSAIEPRERPSTAGNDSAIAAMERMSMAHAASFRETLVMTQESGKQMLAQQALFFENMMKLQQSAPARSATTSESGTGDPAETFRNGMEFMQEMMENVIDKVAPPEKVRAPDDDDGKGTIGMVVEGIKALSEMQKTGAPAAAAAAALGNGAK